MKAVNVSKNDIIVIYDKIGMISAPRAYWLFKTFGLENVMILNGTFSKWLSENRAIDEGDNVNAWKKMSSKSVGNQSF